MKLNAKITMLMFALLTFALVSHAGAGCSKKCGTSHKCSSHGEKGSCGVMKDATMKVENMDDGVKVTLTSDKPESVKALQEHAAACAAKGGDAHMCLHVKGANAEAFDLTNGVEIHITSDKPEIVKELQEHAAKCAVKCAKGEKGHGCAKKGHGFAEDAKVEVQNLPNGATITMTSDDPETVKAIQAHAAECSSKHEKKGM